MVEDVKKVIGHLKRQQDVHYRVICLKLLNAVLMSNMHSESLTDLESARFVILANELLETPIFTDEIIFCKKQILHSLAVLFHNNENYKKAIDYYTEALLIKFHTVEYINKSIPEDTLIKIHLTSSLYLNNQSIESFNMISEIMDIDFFRNQSTADAESFGWIRFAEHYVASNQIDKAADILHNVGESDFKLFISPIHKVILYKDLARIFIRNGDVITGEKYLIIALTLSSEYNYHNQIKKILKMKEVINAKIDLSHLTKIFRL